jgi:hypothetical protein
MPARHEFATGFDHEYHIRNLLIESVLEQWV